MSYAKNDLMRDAKLADIRRSARLTLSKEDLKELEKVRYYAMPDAEIALYERALAKKGKYHKKEEKDTKSDVKDHNDLQQILEDEEKNEDRTYSYYYRMFLDLLRARLKTELTDYYGTKDVQKAAYLYVNDNDQATELNREYRKELRILSDVDEDAPYIQYDPEYEYFKDAVNMQPLRGQLLSTYIYQNTETANVAAYQDLYEQGRVAVDPEMEKLVSNYAFHKLLHIKRELSFLDFLYFVTDYNPFREHAPVFFRMQKKIGLRGDEFQREAKLVGNNEENARRLLVKYGLIQPSSDNFVRNPFLP